MLTQRSLMVDTVGSCQNVYIAGASLLTLPLHHTFAFTTSVLAMLLYHVPICINKSLRTFTGDMQTFQPQNMFLVPLYIETIYKNIWKTAEAQGKSKLLRRMIRLSNALRKVGIDLRRKLFSSVLKQFGGKLNLIVCGGAPLKQIYIDGMDAIGVQVLNGYGITECSPVVAVNRNRYFRSGSIGLPLPCCEVKIIDGEICVKGDIIMAGYYEDEAATRDALEDGWFKTGDIGYLDKDGFLFITGRKKNLIILSNGKNVAPEEMEEKILDIIGVKEVVVYAENDFITAEIFADEQSGIQENIAALNKELPAYKRIQKVKFRNSEFETEILSDTDITIGKPIANTQIYIMDRYLQPVPVGVTGELCIAGDGVCAGYLNRPELTAEKFIDNPFGNGKLYKTGDLAYWREDGNIVFLGRNDFQVKIRGLRIELGEIENAFQGVPSILQAVVTVRKDENGRQLICAFYTGQETDGKALRAAIGQRLPKYMLPHSFTHLDEFPLTSNGKINRKALPEVDLSQIAVAAEYIEPVGETEKQLAALMEQVLGYSPIGRDDDFFDLGGNSLKAIEFVSKAHSEGIYFALQSIFDHPTVQQLTEYIQNSDKQEILYSEADFTEINKILEKNRLEYISTPPKTEVGNVLLAGATGYLGIHILADFIDHENGIAFCLVRGKNQADSEQRLSNLLNFYFGGRYSECDRIRVLCADLQKEHFGLVEQEYEALISKISTVINAAASVKHFGSYQYFYEANVETVKRLIEFCRVAKARLMHTSTLSVSGNSFTDEFSGYISDTEKNFFESSLFIEQPLDNVYARSKFEAEKVVLEAMGKGLKAILANTEYFRFLRDSPLFYRKNLSALSIISV